MTKKIFWLSLVLVLAVVVVSGCGKKEEPVVEEPIAPEQIDLTGAEAYLVQVEDSSLAWEGEMKLVDKKHNGTVAIKSGQLMIRDGQVLVGEAIIDMPTITDEDLTGDDKTKLEDHLKSEDFFGTEIYPEAKLVITKAELASQDNTTDYNITADLTIKDKTNSITFPAKIEMVDEVATATAEFTIDRSLWDIRYGSDSFADDLGDKVISNDIKFTIELTAKKPVVEETTAETEETVENNTVETEVTNGEEAE